MFYNFLYIFIFFYILYSYIYFKFNINLFSSDLLRSRRCDTPDNYWYANGCGVWIGMKDTVGNNQIQDYKWITNQKGEIILP